MPAGDILKPEDLDYSAFGCCSNRELYPYRCSQCGLPFVYCMECSTVYPFLPDTTRFAEDHNATNPSLPSHRCQRCGYTFEYAFIRNRKYRVTRAQWLDAGLEQLLETAGHDRPT